MKIKTLFLLSLLGLLLWGCGSSSQEDKQEVHPAYRGIWYGNQESNDEYKYKYSGGLATYPQQHIPIAIYDEKANKTFFTYGGAQADTNQLAYMVGYFDHALQKVAKPVQISTKQTDDAHDNPVLSIDEQGHLWIFANAHGIARPAFIYKSEKPYDISSFALVDSTNFSYSQPWHLGGKGFLWLRTQYQGNYTDRHLYYSNSENGLDWTAPKILASIEEGNYQISWKKGSKVATAFDHHPSKFWGKEEGPNWYVGLNYRSNIYYASTEDGGESWQNAQGETLSIPLTEVDNPALALNTFKDKQLAYLKDIAFDEQERPIILFLRSNGYEAGPENGPRTWHTLQWDGEQWQESTPIASSDNNYDHGSLYIESDGTWRIIAPIVQGPQHFNPGGEMVMLKSNDQGKTWMQRSLTNGSQFNHTYARKPLNAHPDCYAIWADGHAREPSVSRLYFCNKEGDVFQLPEFMKEEMEAPIPQ